MVARFNSYSTYYELVTHTSYRDDRIGSLQASEKGGVGRFDASSAKDEQKRIKNTR